MIAMEPQPITFPVELRPRVWSCGMHGHHGDIAIVVGTLVSAAGGLIAQAVPQVPPQVTWASVALTFVGFLTLAAKLAHSYAMARLEVERHRGENAALRAEVETYRAVRPRG